jgi:hypothetical protein
MEWNENSKSLIQIKNKEDLWDKIQDTWNNIELETCIKLIETMLQRIKDTIKAKGGYIR